MSTRAEWSRYWRERAGPDKLPAPPRVKRAKPQKNWKDTEVGNKNSPYDWEKSVTGKPSRKSTRRNKLKAMSWPQKRNGAGLSGQSRRIS